MSYLIFFLCCRHNLSHVVSAALRAVGNIVTGDDVQTQVELGSLFSQSSIRNHGFSVLPIHTSKHHMRAIFIQVLKIIQHYDSFAHHCIVFDIKKKKIVPLPQPIRLKTKNTGTCGNLSFYCFGATDHPKLQCSSKSITSIKQFKRKHQKGGMLDNI